MTCGIDVFPVFVVPHAAAWLAYLHLLGNMVHGWHIDIECYVERQPVAERGLHQNVYRTRAWSEVRIHGMVGQRKAYRRYAECRPLHRGAHCAGVKDIDRGVGAVVYACHYKVGPPVEDMMHGKLDAIDRRAGYVIHLRAIIVGKSVDTQRGTYGYRHGLSGLRIKRTDGYHISEIYQSVDERVHAGGSIGIVVADEYQRSHRMR